MNCPICYSKNVDTYSSGNTKYEEYKCKTCGNYVYPKTRIFDNDFPNDKDRLASFLFYHAYKNSDEKYRFNFIGSQEEYNKQFPDNNSGVVVSKQIVDNWYPKTLNEKVNLFLQMLESRSRYLGDVVSLSDEEIKSSCFCITVTPSEDNSYVDFDEQYQEFIKYIEHEKLIFNVYFGGFKLLAKGWNRVDELQKNDKNTKNVFVSMAFSQYTNETREAIRQGIINSGLSPEFIDEIIHNHQIMPEMFRLIRESKMLVLEISDPNFGAYYEAGYALGLGKEVIICCNQDVFNGKITIDGKSLTKTQKDKFGRYLKPHFDIAQKQILVWKDHKDLTKKLEEWIKAIT